MGSGLYSAVSGAISRLQMMDTISDNLSNGQTPGFKKGGVSFEAILERPQRPEDARGIDYAKIKEGYTDFSQGGLTRTGLPLQLAIEGKGFFKVQDANGQVFFTRQGLLRREVSGNLLTPQGMKVLGEDGRPLSFPSEEVVIDEYGVASFPDGEKVKVPVYEIAEVNKLERQGAAFRNPQDQPAATLIESPRVYQGYIEGSNVKAMQEMARMMEALRVFEACQNMMKNYSERDGKVIELGIIG
jgi:flagellar basal body rod protein FlgG